MHQALRIDEIFAVILAFVGHHHLTSGFGLNAGFTPSLNKVKDINASRLSLLSLGLTCKAFLEPALDALWHTQDCMSNLLLRLESIGERVTDHGDPELREVLGHQFEALSGFSFLYLRTDLTQRDRTLLRKYSYRIQHLTPLMQRSKIHRPHVVHPKVLQELQLLNNQSLLFPKLRMVTNRICGLRGGNSGALSTTLFLNMAARVVTLASPNNEFGSVLNCIANSCPNIRTLLIQHRRSQGLAPEMRNMLTNLRHLEELSLVGSYLPEDLFRMVMNMPVLRSTTLNISSTSPGILVDYSQVVIAPDLQLLHLSYKAHSEDDLLKLFKNVKLPRLQTITVDMSLSSSSTLSVRLLMEALAQVAPNSTHLHRIQLHVSEITLQQPSASMTSPHDLHPLLQFPGLVELSLPSAWSYDLDDDFILALAKSFPHLKRLSLGKDARWAQPSGFTLVGFQALSKHCRSLLALDAVVDARVIPVDNGETYPTNQQQGATTIHPLIRLYIPRSSFSKDNTPGQLVEFLVGLFPKLDMIDGWAWEDEGFSDDARSAIQYWNDVADVLATRKAHGDR